MNEEQIHHPTLTTFSDLREKKPQAGEAWDLLRQGATALALDGATNHDLILESDRMARSWGLHEDNAWRYFTTMLAMVESIRSEGIFATGAWVILDVQEHQVLRYEETLQGAYAWCRGPAGGRRLIIDRNQTVLPTQVDLMAANDDAHVMRFTVIHQSALREQDVFPWARGSGMQALFSHPYEPYLPSLED